MIDLADATAIAEYGRHASDAALLAELADALPPAGLDDFVSALDVLERAVSTADAKRTKRKVGWIGRMLGDDIEAQAEGEALRARMGVLLADARREADRVRASDRRLADLEARFEATIARVEADIATGQGVLAQRAPAPDPNEAPIERFRRRLAHLSTLAATHRITREQLRLARAQCAQVLERHAHLHELLGPVWTQHRLSTRGR